MNMALQDFKFENNDFHNVNDFSYMFYATRAISNINPIVDLTSLDFRNATNFNAMFAGTGAQYIKFAEEDDASFSLENVTNLNYFLQSSTAFKGFTGKRPQFVNVTTMHYFMSYARATGDVDLSNLGLHRCIGFNGAFQDTRYTSIDLSGIHSTVTSDNPNTTLISMYNMFYANPNLNYAILTDAEFKVGVDAMGLFLNCPMLTFVKDLDFTKNEDLDVYFSGGGTMVYKDGKSPFDNLIVAPGVVRRVNDMFKQDALLRGFPDGYLSGLKMARSYTYGFASMFEGAFNTSISAAVQLTEEEYKKIYQVDLDFEQPTQIIQKNVFKDCTNLAVIKFSNTTKLCFNYTDSNVGNISVIPNLGRAAFESGRISSFDFYFNDTEFYEWGCNVTRDHVRYFFRNNNFNEYVINGETGKAKVNIHLSNDCTIAKRQISKFKTGAYVAFGEENVTFVGPDGCNLG